MAGDVATSCSAPVFDGEVAKKEVRLFLSNAYVFAPKLLNWLKTLPKGSPEKKMPYFCT